MGNYGILKILFQATCGSDTISYYSLEIFAKAEVPLNEYILSILLQAGFTMSFMLSSSLMNIMKRRNQYLISGSLMAFCMLMLSFCMYAIDLSSGSLREVMKIGQPMFVILSGVTYGLGVGPVVFSLTNELFPARVKGVCSTIAMASR